MTGWTSLLIAGCFEIAYTSLMKLSDGFSKLHYTVLFGLCALLSFYFLNRSLTVIPLGTAYAVWTGIGAVGTVIVGIMFFGDPVSVARLMLLAMLVGSIVGLKLV